jgi:hypothetical protein
MSQSNPSYGVNSPKGTARSRHEQHDNQSEPTPTNPVEPACRARKSGRGAKRREWREMPYDNRTRAFYQPCEWCYPDNEPNESDVETVIRSCRDPTKYHRPRDDHELGNAPTAGPPDATNIQNTGDPIESVTDLRIGQRVIWENREYPLRVVETASKPDGTVALRGHNGGEYQLEGRPKHAQPYYISSYGCRSVIRVEHRTERV